MRTFIAIITFDDMCRENTRAAKLLERYGIQGVFFLTTANLKVLKDGIEDIAMMHEVGSHTHTHADLTVLSKEEVYYELRHSKEILRVTTNKEVISFAYPHGRFTEEVMKAVRDVGYLIARTATIKPPIKEIIVPYEVPVFISEYLLSNKSLMHNIAKFAKLRILEARLAWRTLKGSSRGGIRTA